MSGIDNIEAVTANAFSTRDLCDGRPTANFVLSNTEIREIGMGPIADWQLILPRRGKQTVKFGA